MIQVLHVCMWWIIPHINRVKKASQLFWGKLSAWRWLSRNAAGVISLNEKTRPQRVEREGIDVSGCLKMAVLSCWSASFWDSIPLQQPLFPPSSSPGAPPSPQGGYFCTSLLQEVGTVVVGGSGGPWASCGGSKPLTPCHSFLSLSAGWTINGRLRMNFTPSGFNIVPG